MKLLAKMKRSAPAVEELKMRLHAINMDRTHFDELARSENTIVTTGVDHEKGQNYSFPGRTSWQMLLLARRTICAVYWVCLNSAFRDFF